MKSRARSVERPGHHDQHQKKTCVPAVHPGNCYLPMPLGDIVEGGRRPRSSLSITFADRPHAAAPRNRFVLRPNRMDPVRRRHSTQASRPKKGDEQEVVIVTPLKRRRSMKFQCLEADPEGTNCASKMVVVINNLSSGPDDSPLLKAKVSQ